MKLLSTKLVPMNRFTSNLARHTFLLWCLSLLAGGFTSALSAAAIPQTK